MLTLVHNTKGGVSMKAFTLIELIVVIAIVGVLSAILIPSLIGHIGEARLATANSNAKTAYTNSCIYVAKCAAKDAYMQGEVDLCAHPLRWNGLTPPQYTADGTAEDMGKALSQKMGSASSSAGYVTVKTYDGAVTGAFWARSVVDEYVGHFPEPAENKGEYVLD